MQGVTVLLVAMLTSSRTADELRNLRYWGFCLVGFLLPATIPLLLHIWSAWSWGVEYLGRLFFRALGPDIRIAYFFEPQPQGPLLSLTIVTAALITWPSLLGHSRRIAALATLLIWVLAWANGFSCSFLPWVRCYTVIVGGVAPTFLLPGYWLAVFTGHLMRSLFARRDLTAGLLVGLSQHLAFIWFLTLSNLSFGMLAGFTAPVFAAMSLVLVLLPSLKGTLSALRGKS